MSNDALLAGLRRKREAYYATADQCERFWFSVFPLEGPNACWLWGAGRKRAEWYGRFRWEAGKEVASHRAAYLLFVGEIPLNMEVCHTCDVRGCVRPDHLFLGTHRENMRDAKRKGRAVMPPRSFGIDHPRAVLDPEKVRTIRQLAADGASNAQTGRQIGHSRQLVASVVSGRTWRAP